MKENQKLKVITVGGMIGVGKTTFIENLLKEDKKNGIKSKAIYELYEPEKQDTSIFPEKTTRDSIMDLFLELYYGNIHLLDSDNEYERTTALNVTLGHQVNFLANRASKIVDAVHLAQSQDLDVLYLDRTIFEDLLFTKLNLFDNQIYWMAYMVVWDLWFNTVNHCLKNVDLQNIILTGSIEIILSRIKKRGRAMEQTPELEEYFRNLNKSYEKDLKDFMISKGWDYTIINNED